MSFVRNILAGIVIILLIAAVMPLHVSATSSGGGEDLRNEITSLVSWKIDKLSAEAGKASNPAVANAFSTGVNQLGALATEIPSASDERLREIGSEAHRIWDHTYAAAKEAAGSDVETLRKEVADLITWKTNKLTKYGEEASDPAVKAAYLAGAQTMRELGKTVAGANADQLKEISNKAHRIWDDTKRAAASAQGPEATLEKLRKDTIAMINGKISWANKNAEEYASKNPAIADVYRKAARELEALKPIVTAGDAAAIKAADVKAHEIYSEAKRAAGNQPDDSAAKREAEAKAKAEAEAKRRAEVEAKAKAEAEAKRKSEAARQQKREEAGIPKDKEALAERAEQSVEKLEKRAERMAEFAKRYTGLSEEFAEYVDLLEIKIAVLKAAAAEGEVDAMIDALLATHAEARLIRAQLMELKELLYGDNPAMIAGYQLPG